MDKVVFDMAKKQNLELKFKLKNVKEDLKDLANEPVKKTGQKYNSVFVSFSYFFSFSLWLFKYLYDVLHTFEFCLIYLGNASNYVRILKKIM